MRVLLIAGGWSEEREVSLSGARKIHENLKALGHETTFFDLSRGWRELLEQASSHDFAFLNLHGSPGEDGIVQAMLERVGCPYQGSGPAASFLALDKAASKALFVREGIPTPAWRLVTEKGDRTPPEGLSLPLFVKPNTGGSSLGAGRVESPEDYGPALDDVFELGRLPLTEELTAGEEVTCSVMDDTPLPLILIRPAGGSAFFDYEAKYRPGGAEEICPAPIPEVLAERVRELSLKAHAALGLAGYSRADFIVKNGVPFLLEVNTLPGMTPTSLLPQAAAQAGFSFQNLVARLMQLGLERFGKDGK